MGCQPFSGPVSLASRNKEDFMNDEKILSQLLDNVHLLNTEKAYYKAVEIGISAYFFGIGKEENIKELAMTILLASFSGILNEKLDTNNVCDFCGKGGKSVRLYAGPNAIICNECVETFAKMESEIL
jgi:hypothetical protein